LIYKETLAGVASQMEDFSWTTGSDTTISHIRKIGSGASGEVHQVFSLSLVDIDIDAR